MKADTCRLRALAAVLVLAALPWCAPLHAQQDVANDPAVHRILDPASFTPGGANWPEDFEARGPLNLRGGQLRVIPVSSIRVGNQLHQHAIIRGNYAYYVELDPSAPDDPFTVTRGGGVSQSSGHTHVSVRYEGAATHVAGMDRDEFVFAMSGSAHGLYQLRSQDLQKFDPAPIFRKVEAAAEPTAAVEGAGRPVTGAALGLHEALPQFVGLAATTLQPSADELALREAAGVVVPEAGLRRPVARAEDLVVREIDTEGGRRSLVLSAAWLQAGRYTAAVGPDSPASLWHDAARARCYSLTLQMVAQGLAAREAGTPTAAWQRLQRLAGGADGLAATGKALGALDALRVDIRGGADDVAAELARLTESIRVERPEGAPAQLPNLTALAAALRHGPTAGACSDLAVAAALRAALAADLALGQMDTPMTLLLHEQADPALRTAWEDARHHLTRDEFYWGALASALSARAAAVAGRGVAAVVAELHGDVSGLVEQYMTEVRNMSAAETEKSVSTTRQYWAVALTAPYWTLSENLDARTHLQVGVTGATLAHLLRQTATTAGREDDALLKAVRERAATVYYHETVQAATGPLPAFRDPLPGPTSPTAVAGVLPGFSQ